MLKYIVFILIIGSLITLGVLGHLSYAEILFIILVGLVSDYIRLLKKNEELLKKYNELNEKNKDLKD